MRRLIVLWIVAVMTGCASGGERGAAGLRLSAAAAVLEARTQAVPWDDDAALRYVEAEGVTANGYVLAEGGEWRFVYEAPGRTDQLVVSVTPLSIEREVRPKQSPPGFVLGENTLRTGWLDSPAALEAVRTAGGAALLDRDDVAISLLLVPTAPIQWIVRAAAGAESRQWRVNALTGEVLSS